MHLDFHAHNDYGFATANSFFALLFGANGIHCTINGLGERAGNTTIEELITIVNDFSPLKSSVDEKHFCSLSRLVEAYSGMRLARNKPIVGKTVFTHTAGVHADGDKKGGLYQSQLSAERFERKTRYALGKLSGKASVEMALKEFGIVLEPNLIQKLLSKVVELGEKKEIVTKEDLLFLLDEVCETKHKDNNHWKRFEIKDYSATTALKKKPRAKITFKLNGVKFESCSTGNGGYDAFMNALKIAFRKEKTNLAELVDYEVRIPIGGKTDALVETRIVWSANGTTFETVGTSTDQLEAAIKATEKMIKIIHRI